MAAWRIMVPASRNGAAKIGFAAALYLLIDGFDWMVSASSGVEGIWLARLCATFCDFPPRVTFSFLIVWHFFSDWVVDRGSLCPQPVTVV